MAEEPRESERDAASCAGEGCPFCRPVVTRFLLPALLLAAFDQYTKALVLERMAPGDSFAVLGPVMSLTRAHNSGAFFSLFSSVPGVLTAVGVILAGAVLVWGWWALRHQPEMVAPLALILGGALGNLADRLTRGEVVDFLDFHFWPVFNVADIALTLGVLFAAWRLLRPAPASR
jgi:signal peptidase II